ncbi:MAG: ISLre2 family transposase [Bacillota bacterium]|nr:ISLre2 family transposase [Bacillota bacterium]
MFKASLSLDQISASFKSLERLAHQEGMRVAREGFTSQIKQVEQQIHAQRPVGFEVVGWRPRRIQTLMGEVEIRRRCYRDGDGSYRWLFDEALGLERSRRVSPGLEQVMLTLACEHTYRGTADLIEQLLGVRIEAQTAHSEVQRAGARIGRQEAKRVRSVLDGEMELKPGRLEAQMLLVEADGVVVQLQREGRQKSAEIKHGIAYDGWERQGGRYVLKNKRRYAMIGDPEQFWDTFGMRVHQTWDLSSVQRVVIGGDGANWVKQGLEHFCASEFQLDEYHTRKRISQALQNKQWARAVGDCVVSGEWQRAIQVVDAIAQAEPRYKPECSDLSRWIRDNHVELQDYRLRPRPLPQGARGTGAIESNVDKNVANRFKKRGRGWTIRGASNLLVVMNASQRVENEPQDMRSANVTGLFEGVDTRLARPHATMPALERGNNSRLTRVLREISTAGRNRTY